MSTSRLSVDDRYRGLAERPGAVFVGAEASLSSAISSRTDDTVVGLSARDRKSMDQQIEIACRYGAVVERVAARHGMLPSIIAGFCSRRSRWGLDLLPVGIEGTRDLGVRVPVAEERKAPLPPDGFGFERGLMGLDFDRHPLARGPDWRDPESNIEAAFALIAGYRTTLRRRTTLQGMGVLRAALTAFECGFEPVERAIRHGLDVDSPTPGWAPKRRGCGQDVLARAGFFQAAGWE